MSNGLAPLSVPLLLKPLDTEKPLNVLDFAYYLFPLAFSALVDW